MSRTLPGSPPNWTSAEATHTGNKRLVNEDAVFCDERIGVWAVADGMGGHEAGDYASAAIVDALARIEPGDDLAETVDRVEDALLGVDTALKGYAETRFGGETVGSTAVVMISVGRVGVALWAGDSRLYRLRGLELEQITRDHNPIADLLDAGAVTEEEAMSANTNIVTRAIGGHGDLHLDIVVFDVELGDRYLLCTDGLYQELDAQALNHCLQLNQPEACVDQALKTCLAGAASDNVSLVAAYAAGRAA